MKGGLFDIPIYVHLLQPQFRSHLEAHCNSQLVALLDLSVPIEDDWIRRKPKHQHNILDIIDLHEEEQRKYHHACVIEKHDIETVKLVWNLPIHD